MTSPVERAMRSLIAASKPAPAEVTIVPQKLKGGAEVIKYWLATAILLQLRTLTVWGFLAIFFPQLGITYLLVMCGLYALRHAVPTKPQLIIDNIAAQRI